MGFNRAFVNVIGSGFAGIECSLFLAGHGIKVHLFDDEKYHDNKLFNSVDDYSYNIQINKFLLKKELAVLGSPLIKAKESLIDQGYKNEDINSVLLSIGKDMVKNNKNIEYFPVAVSEISPNEITIIATGSYTDENMINTLTNKFGLMRFFKHMPVYPIISNINENYLVKQDEKHYVMQLNYQEYIDFINKIVKQYNAKLDEGDFETIEDSIEYLVRKDKDSLKTYAMNPVCVEGENEKPYASLKLKKTKHGFKILDFCSKFDIDSQFKIFSSLKGFENITIERKADLMNVCCLNARYVINNFHQCMQNENLFFAGAILGVKGFTETVASGLYTAINVKKYYSEEYMPKFPKNTCIGVLADKILSSTSIKPHPFLEEYGIIESEDVCKKDEMEKIIETSMKELAQFKEVYKNGKYV